MLVDAVAQVELDAERHAPGDEPARDGEDQAQHPGDRDQQHEQPQPVAVAVLDGADRGARQPGDRNGRDHRQQREEARPPQARLVVAQEAEKAHEHWHRSNYSCLVNHSLRGSERRRRALGRDLRAIHRRVAHFGGSAVRSRHSVVIAAAVFRGRISLMGH